MKLDDLQRKLIAAARKNPPDDGVPYAFEKRVMARLHSSPSSAFAPGMYPSMRAWWVAAAASASIALLAGVWSVSPLGQSQHLAAADALDETVLAAALDDGDTSFE